LSILAKYIATDHRAKGTLLDRVLTCGLSPVGVVLGERKRVKLGGRTDGADGVVDTLPDLLHRDTAAVAPTPSLHLPLTKILNDMPACIEFYINDS
jgi:hypothetical protein